MAVLNWRTVVAVISSCTAMAVLYLRTVVALHRSGCTVVMPCCNYY